MKLTWDLTHLYINDEEWEKDFILLNQQVEQLEIKKEYLIDNVELFEEFLELKIEVDERVERLYCYAKRHLDLDSTLELYKNKLDNALNVYSKIQTINHFFEQAITFNSDKVKEYLNHESLRRYTRYLNLILRRKDHIVDEKDVEKYSTYMKEQQDLKSDYQSVLQNMSYKTIELNGEEVVVDKKHYSDLILDSNQENRKLVFDTYSMTYEEVTPKLAKLYCDKLKQDIFLAKSQHYDSLLRKVLFEFELPNSIVENLISVINKHLSVMHCYGKLKKQISGLAEFHIYDSNLSICEISKMKIDFEEAIKIVKESLSVLGDDYIKIIDRMFEEGWVDVYPSDNKRTMSFTAISYVGVPYILLNYNKSISDVRTTTHEIGHGMHVYYAKQNNSFEYFEFSCFLAEITSKVNEFLTNEYMLEHSDDVETKKYILNNIIGSLGNSLFGQTMLTEFEHQVITNLYNGIEITEEDLNQLYFDISKKYNGDVFTYDDNVKYGWTKIQHFVMQDTYYLYQYAIGAALASHIAYKILNNEDNMIEKYKKFLTLGNSVNIEDSLTILGIDLNDSSYIDHSVKVLSKKIEQLKSLI